MRYKDKWISILFIALFLLMMTAGSVCASETYSSGYFHYTLDDESVSVTGYFGKEETVTVPPSIAGYPVSRICSGAFVKAKTVKVINLPDTIMTIEEGAFKEGQTVSYSSPFSGGQDVHHESNDEQAGDHEDAGGQTENDEITGGEGTAEQSSMNSSSSSSSGASIDQVSTPVAEGREDLDTLDSSTSKSGKKSNGSTALSENRETKTNVGTREDSTRNSDGKAASEKKGFGNTKSTMQENVSENSTESPAKIGTESTGDDAAETDEQTDAVAQTEAELRTEFVEETEEDTQIEETEKISEKTTEMLSERESMSMTDDKPVDQGKTSKGLLHSAYWLPVLLMAVVLALILIIRKNAE